MPFITEFWKQRRVYLCEFEERVIYKVSPMTAKAVT